MTDGRADLSSAIEATGCSHPTEWVCDQKMVAGPSVSALIAKVQPMLVAERGQEMIQLVPTAQRPRQ